jgi:hypothetical protein
MRQLLLFTLIFFMSNPIWGQKNKEVDFSKVDKFALQTPDSMTTDVEQLALYLTSSHFASSTEKKIRAIYVWVSQNIHYDNDFDLTSPFTTPDVVATQDADVVLAARKGVCMGYAQLFVALTQATGLKAEVVDGIIKQSDGTVPKMGHSWVAVRLRRKADMDAKAEPRWYLCDPTWAAPASKNEFGKINETYFLAEGEDFIKDHMPLDPMWQLLERPATADVFSKESEEKIRKYVSKSSKYPFVFADTIKSFLKMDTLKRAEKATWRMLHYNPINDYIWFEAGKVYAKHFLNFNATIGRLIRLSFVGSTLLANDEKFENKLQTLRLYFQTFKDCYAQIEDKTIAEKGVLFSENFIKTLISSHRSGYQVAGLNAFIENSNKTTPKMVETVKLISDKIDSTLSSTRQFNKKLDTSQQKSIESELLIYEEIEHQKNIRLLHLHMEESRMTGMKLSQKTEMYNLLSLGRMHIRKYKTCMDSSEILNWGFVNNSVSDVFFDTYSFLFDVEECVLNGNFLMAEIAIKNEKGTSNDLIPYIQQLKDAYSCSNFVKEKGLVKSKIINDLIDSNYVFFRHIDVGNFDDLAYIYHAIAIDLWNENLADHKAVKNDILYYLNLEENAINEALMIHKEILKRKETIRTKEQIVYLEKQIKECLKMKDESKN